MKSFLFIIVFWSSTIFAQESADSTLNRWIPSLVTGVNVSQVSFTDWAKGGENSLSWTLTGDFILEYNSDSWSFKNEIKGEFGKTQLGETGVRVTGNEFFWESVLSLNVGWAVDPFVSNQVRTQFTTGYDYEVDPAVKIAGFFDPGYITQSLGFTYKTNKYFKSRFGLAFQETFTDKYRKYSDDPDTDDELEDFKFETGVESVSQLKVGIAENMNLDSKLRLFTRFENIDVWDVRWDNTITGKVNSWLSVRVEFILLYEKAQSVKTQIKQALQLGIVYKIL